MNKQFNKKLGVWLLLLGSAFGNYAVYADKATDDIQRQLNQQVLNQPFSVADEATLNASLNAATERGKTTENKSPATVYDYYGTRYYHPYSYGYGIGYYRPHYHSYNPYYLGYYW